MMIKQKIEEKKLRKNFTVRLNQEEKKKLEVKATKLKFPSSSSYLRNVAIAEIDPLSNLKIKGLSDLNRTLNLLKAIYKQAQKDKTALEILEVVKFQLEEIKEQLKQKEL